MLIKNLLRLVETLMVTVVVAAHAKPIHAAATYLIVRAIGTPIMAWLMMRKTVWLRYGLGHATRQRTKSLAVPAVAYMAFPAGSALSSLQGMVILVIAAMLGAGRGRGSFFWHNAYPHSVRLSAHGGAQE